MYCKNVFLEILSITFFHQTLDLVTATAVFYGFINSLVLIT